jgi:hypothetical protein
MQRQPAVAGQFYPGSTERLRKTLEQLLPAHPAAQPAIALMAPHAGYVYSGAIAAETYARAAVPDTVVLLGPNHHGIGHPAALYGEGSWATPLGDVPIDAAFASRLLKRCPDLAADVVAHRLEHSLEVQVPFLQMRNPRLRLVPICLGHLPLQKLIALGEGIGETIASSADPVLIVASSDMTHYEPGAAARQKDERALEHVLALDPEGLYRTVREGRISMCGVLPTVVMLAAARRLGAVSATLVRYGNSGDVTGDQSAVVGYAGVVVA